MQSNLSDNFAKLELELAAMKRCYFKPEMKRYHCFIKTNAFLFLLSGSRQTKHASWNLVCFCCSPLLFPKLSGNTAANCLQKARINVIAKLTPPSLVLIIG